MKFLCNLILGSDIMAADKNLGDGRFQKRLQVSHVDP